MSAEDILDSLMPAETFHPMAKAEIGRVEDFLRGLLKGEHSNLTLTFNDHTANYIDAAKEYADGGMPDDEWVSESERDKALGLNQVWTLQWYPDSPVSCHIVRASSLHALFIRIALHVRTD